MPAMIASCTRPVTALLATLLLCGCPGPPPDSDPPADDTEAPVDHEPWGPGAIDSLGGGETTCSDDYLDAPDDLPAPEPGDSPGQLAYTVRLVTDDFDPLCVVVRFPEDRDTRLYDAGAPVVVSALPGLKAQEAGAAQVDARAGFVEVQPLYPGWAAGNCTTSGDNDMGAYRSAAAVRDGVLFATGQLRTDRGHSIGQLVGMPLCDDQVVITGPSSGAGVAHSTLARFPDQLVGSVMGMALFEVPPTGQFVTLDGGAYWMDTDKSVDSDGNGYAWDDGQNPSYDDGDCASYNTCDLDYSNMLFVPEMTVADVFPFLIHTESLGGLFYLDNNGNGQLDTAEGGTTDTNGNGGVDDDEDYLLLPNYHSTWSDPSKQYFSTEVAQAAEDLGLFGEGEWPAEIAEPRPTAEYWSQRTSVPFMDDIAAHYPPPFRVALGYTEYDHGPPQVTHPNMWVLNSNYLDLGVSVRLIGDWEMLQCVLSKQQLGDWQVDLEPDVRVPEQRMHDYAIPESLDITSARGTAVMSLFWDTLGPFDNCPARQAAP